MVVRKIISNFWGLNHCYRILDSFKFFFLSGIHLIPFTKCKEFYRMALDKDLEKKALPISEVKLDATEFVLKLHLLRCGPILNYKTKKGEGIRQQLIFVDEEGTKIQTTLFNEFTEKWRTLFVASNTYYVINGRIRRPLMLFNDLNKYKELSVTQFTEIRDCTATFETKEFSNGFTSIDYIELMESDFHYDIVGVFVETSELIITSGYKRRIVTITNKRHDRVSVTLWGDHAEHDGLCVDNAEPCKTVIAFCNVKKTEFNGSFGFGSTAFTSVILNPTFEKSVELLEWSHSMIEDSIDISLAPSGQIRRATEMKLWDMVTSRNDKPQNVYCRFNATIKEVLKKETLCYTACKKCFRKVNIQESTIYCEHCEASQDTFTYRYFVRLVLLCDKKIPTVQDTEFNTDLHCITSDKSENIVDGGSSPAGKNKSTGVAESDMQYEVTVKLFEGAKYFVGCSADEYMASIADKPELSEYFQKIVRSEGQKYTFMVKNYHTVAQYKRFTDFVIEEMHLVGLAGFPDIDQAEVPTNSMGKRPLDINVEQVENVKATPKKAKETKK